jgi:tetratricopeptide (TPR) repeat protein
MKISRWQVLRYSYYVVLGGQLKAMSCYRIAEAVHQRGLEYSKSKGSDGFIRLFTQEIAFAQYLQGRNQAALQLMNELVERYPNEPSPHRQLADLHMRCGNYPQAVMYFEKALQLEKDPKLKEEISDDLANLQSILKHASPKPGP